MSIVRDKLRNILRRGGVLNFARRGRNFARDVRYRIQIRADLHSARKTMLASQTLTADEKRIISRVSLRIHPHDDMYLPGTGRHYLSIAISSYRCIMAALAHAPSNPLRTILDLPVGFGRALRLFKIAFPHAALYGCDINTEAVQFCKQEFGIDAVQSNQDFTKVSFPHSFDLIWSGSLLTHLDESHAINLLKLFYRSLSPNGLCVFTMHGRTSAGWLESRVETYNLTEPARLRVLSGFAKDGYGYADYPWASGYGISVAKRERIVEMASAVGNWSFSSFHESVWSDQHDVYAFSKSSVTKPLIVEAQELPATTNVFKWIL
jgi:SAM-dependent methyltransferase